MGYDPSEPEHFCKKMRRKDGSTQFAFSMRLRLEDATGEVDAVLWAQDAETLLGVKACDMRGNERQMDRATSFVHKMMGYVGDSGDNNGDHGDNGDHGGQSYKVEWQDLCLFSYFLPPKQEEGQKASDEGGFWDACHFHIFDTIEQKGKD